MSPPKSVHLDLDAARTFLAALDPEGAVDAPHSFWTQAPDALPTPVEENTLGWGGPEHLEMRGALDDVCVRLAQLNQRGAAVMVGLHAANPEGRVHTLRAVCCRWDRRCDAPDLLHVDPSIIVRIGASKYAYWLLHKDEAEFDAQCEDWLRLQLALERDCGSIAGVVDTDFKVPVPGFVSHEKRAADPELYDRVLEDLRFKISNREILLSWPSPLAAKKAWSDYEERGGTTLPPELVEIEKCDRSLRYEFVHIVRGFGVELEPPPSILPPDRIETDTELGKVCETPSEVLRETVPPPEIDDAIAYLKALDPDEERFTFQTYDDLGGDGELARILHGNIQEVLPALSSLNGLGAGVFVSVHATDFLGRKGRNIVYTRAFFCDWDDGPPPPGTGALAPSIMVSRAADGYRRYHGYWLLTESVEPERWKVIQHALVKKLCADPAAILLTQALRVPGFYNCKRKPDLVELESCHPELRYTVDQIIEAYQLGPIVAALTEKPKPRAPSSQKDGPADEYVTRGDWSVLERNGWTIASRDGDETRWTKPGGKRKKIHATTDHAGRMGIFKVFSSKAPPFMADKAYNRFQVLAELEHGGDYSHAAKALVAQGYGTPDEERRRAWAAENDEAQWEMSMESEEAERSAVVHVHGALPPDSPWFEGLPSSSGHPASGGGRGGSKRPHVPAGSGSGSGGSGNGHEPAGQEFAPQLWALNSVKSVAKGPDNIPMTHVGNRERFLDHYGRSIRYVKTFERWYVWNGMRWRVDTDAEEAHVRPPCPKGEDLAAYIGASDPDPFDAGNYVLELSMMVARSMHALVDHIFVQARDDSGAKIIRPDGKPEMDEAKTVAAKSKWVAHCVRTENESGISQMLRLARSHRDIARSPSFFDPYDHLINTEHGVQDLRTGISYPHHPGLSQSKIVRIKPKRSGCPTWTRFLARVLRDDDDLIRFVQRAVGYSLTGETREQVLFLLYGTGRNGKSTFLNVLHALAGEYAQHAEFSTFVERQTETVRNDLARLHKSRLVTAVEPKQTGYLDESVIKQVTGQDVVTARFLFKEHFEYVPRFKIWLAANHKPMIRGNDEGIWRRILMVPFTVTIPEKEKDPNLARKLAAELPAIFSWAADGAKLWYEESLQIPNAVREATKAYRDEMDSIGMFLHVKCVVLPNVRSMATALYRHYVRWTEIGGERPLSQKKFGMRLEERGIARKRTKAGYEYLGIAVSDEHETESPAPRAYRD